MADTAEQTSAAQDKERRGMEIVAELIRRNFDVGEVGLPRWLESAHQRRHRKMVVETDKGKFLAKTYHRQPVVLDALMFQHNLSDHLRKNQLPVAGIQRTKEGRGFAEADTWILELQEFVDGASMRVTSKTLGTAGDALGRFHQVCQYLNAPPRDTLMWRFSEVPRPTFEQMYTQACEESSADAIAPFCDSLAKFSHDASKALDASKRDLFETGLIHGDWHGGNLMFRGEDLAAIVDLEFAGSGCYLEDLAYGISNLCIRTSTNEERLRLRTNIMLDHYQRHRTLSYAEVVALYYAVGVKHITTVAYQIRLLKTIAGFNSAEWMERLAHQCRWLTEQSRKARWGD